MAVNFHVLTSENIHWALNANIQMALEELSYKVPTSGGCSLQGDLIGDGNRERKIINPTNYGRRSAYTRKSELGLEGDPYINVDTFAFTLEELWALYREVFPTPSDLKEYFLLLAQPSWLARLESLENGAANLGTAGGTVSISGTSPVKTDKVSSITVGGTVFESDYYYWRPSAGNSLSLLYANAITSQEYSVVAWVKVKPTVFDTNGFWVDLFNLSHASTTTRWATLSRLGETLSFRHNTASGQKYIVATSPEGMRSHLSGSVSALTHVLGGPDRATVPTSIWPHVDYYGFDGEPEVEKEVLVTFSYSPTSGAVVTIDNKKFTVKELAAASTVSNPTAPGLTLSWITFSNFWENVQFGPITVYDVAITDDIIAVHQLLRM